MTGYSIDITSAARALCLVCRMKWETIPDTRREEFLRLARELIAAVEGPTPEAGTELRDPLSDIRDEEIRMALDRMWTGRD